jgi:hypothetical protein
MTSDEVNGALFGAAVTAMPIVIAVFAAWFHHCQTRKP